MTNLKVKKLLSVLLVFAMIFALAAPASALDLSKADSLLLTTRKQYSIAPGISEEHITTVLKDTGKTQVQAYVALVDPKQEGVSFLAGYKNHDKTGSWGMQTLRDQAKAAENATGENVVFGINADYFNMGNGCPLGALVMGGTVVHEQANEYYFALLRDGTIELRNPGTPFNDTGDPQKDVIEAVGSPFKLVENGNVVVGDDGSRMPTGAVGLTADGQVIFITADGRQEPKSCGYTMTELAKVLISYGAVEAIYFDGGGSATFASKHEGEVELTVKNSPSDGTERKVSSCLFVTSAAKPTGEFDHAVLEPRQEIYTPNSTVEFSAIGSDSVGTRTALPEGVKFALKDAKMGAIDAESGVFVSSGKLGEVDVDLILNGEVVGSTQVEIAEPDEITFATEEITLGFNQESTLGLMVKSKNRSINYNDGDFVWSIANDAFASDGQYVFKKDGQSLMVGYLQGYAPKYYEKNEAGGVGNILEALSNEDVELFNQQNQLTADKYLLNKTYTFTKDGQVYNVIIDKDGDYQLRYYANESVGTYLLGALSEEDSKLFCEQVLGTFDGNTFLSSEDNSVSGMVTCAYKGNAAVNGSIHAIIGQAPTVAYDFEDYITDGTESYVVDNGTEEGEVRIAEPGQLISAVDYWTPDQVKPGHPTANLGTMNYARGGKVSCEIVDIASGEPVRKGNYSLKLNYDFTECSAAKGTEGANVGPMTADIEIPGQPTAIGMYVYAPEGTANYWLRVELKDGNGTIVRSDFTEACSVAKGEYGGFDWTGWKYVEADLTGKQGPFTFNGRNMVRLMYVPGQGSGDYDCNGNPIPASERKGAIYVDNIQFVYGANPIDIDSPVVDTVSANNAELKDGDVINSNVVDFSATVSDVENKYTTGVDFSTANVWIDGVNLTNDGGLHTDDSKNSIMFYDQHLANGLHTIKFLIRDKEGNETIETRTFTVQGEDNIPVLSAALESDSVHLNDRAVINLTGSNIDVMEDVTAQFKLASGFTDYVVKYADGFEESKAPVFDEKSNTVTISAKKTADSSAEATDLIASVEVLVPNEIGEGTQFSFSVPSAVYNIKAEEETKRYSFSCGTRYADIKAYYDIVFDDLMAGFDSIFTITDENGAKAKGVTLKTADGEVLGVTDLKGVVTISSLREPQTLSIYIEDAQGRRSFVTPIRVFALGASVEGIPTFVKVSDVADSQSAKSITWVANPGYAEKKAVAQVALKSDYADKGVSAFKSVNGTSNIVKFDAEADATANKILYANSVVIADLKADSEYVYRVGDGSVWSEVYSFKTLYNGADTNFFIIGDTQADDMKNINSILNLITNGDTEYAFGVQTGDFVDAPKRYHQWENILNAFGTDFFKSTDMIHVIGNHEQMGDPDAEIAQAMFNIKDTQHYSVTYGNVYVAVLGYASGEKKAQEDAEWLVSDASRSDAKWKIVVSHQPPFGTNETTTDCDNFHKYLSEACDKADIDFFFSGHDHAYARTKPVKNGEAADEGTVYFVCGSTGEKSYPASNVKHNYPFAIFGNDNYDALYITANATADSFTIQAHDESGKVIDTYTKTKAGCNGIHSFVLTNDNHLVCSNCSYARKADGYTGLVKDQAIKLNKYLVNGTAVKNEWRANGDDHYYFGEDGVAVTGTVKINNIEYTFDNNGKFVRGSFVEEEVTNPDTGVSKTITRYYGASGELGRRWQVIDGEYYFFYSPLARPYDYGYMFKGGRKKVTTANQNTVRYFTFADDGRLLIGAFETDKDENGNIIVGKTRYYWGDEYVTQTTTADGVTYEFDENGYIKNRDIADCTFTEIASEYVYTGKAIKPTVTVKAGDETLKAGTSDNYTIAYSDNTNAGTATITVTGNPERGFVGTKTFTFKIVHDLTKAEITVPSYVTYTGKAVKPSITVKSATATLKEGTNYTLTFKNNKNPGTATVTISAKGANVTGKVQKTFRVRLAAPTVKATQKSKETTVNVKWNQVDKATGYRIYRSENGKDFTKIATVKSSVLTYNDAATKVGKTYTYKVYATYTTSDGQSPYSATSSVKVVAPSAVKTVKATSTASSVTLTITKVSNAAGYQIYRATSKNGKYTLVKTQTGTTFKDTNVKSGKQYFYKVRAYKLNGKTKTYGGFSSVISAVTAPAAVKNVTAKASGKNVTVKFDAASGATGYTVYRSTKKNGTYKAVGTVTKTTFTDKNLKSGSYYYAVRPYKSASGVKSYSPLADAKKVSVKVK